MPVIGLKGIRNAAGTSSIAAGLSWALHALGESVLVIDFSPENLLRLHFNMPFLHSKGWARAYHDDTPWQESAMRYIDHLDFIPFGTLAHTELSDIESHLKREHTLWPLRIKELKATKSYQWILLDLPTASPSITEQLENTLEHIFVVLNPDMNCHVRLHQQNLPKNSFLLLNKFNPNSSLQKDLHLLWRKTLPNLLSQLVHLDESMSESLAAKQPVGEYAPTQLAAQELTTLANWCLLNCTKDL